MLKPRDIAGLSQLTHLFNFTLGSMKMPVEWQTVAMVPIFTKEDQRVRSNYPVITLLSLPGRVYVRVL